MFEIRGYQLLERLGKGSMAEVCLARQPALGRFVAIRFLMPDGAAEPDAVWSFPAARRS
jgi:serine/threonine protein kinase